MKNDEKPQNLIVLNNNESHDRIVYGITHDFNNLITQIYTNLEVAILDKDLNVETKSTIENAIASLDQAIELLEKLKTISRPLSNKEHFINPVQVLSDLVKKIEGTIDLKIHLENKITHDLSVKIDKLSFSRVIENLIDNAIYACSFSEKPEIFILLEKENDFFQIIIEDSGEGVPNHLTNFVFNPYFTTKKNNIGSGVGLSISRTLAVAAGGNLELSPQKKRLTGASFTISLPASISAPTAEEIEINYRPEDLTGKHLFICAEDKIIKNHLFILNKLKTECHHFGPHDIHSLDFSKGQVVIISLSNEVVKFGIVKLIKMIPLNIPIIVISSSLESSSYLNELQRPHFLILDLPITFNIFAKSILKLIDNSKL